MSKDKYTFLEELGILPHWQLRGVPSLSHDLSSPWASIEKNMLTCRACGLCQGRQQVVIGDGSKEASWMFIGEGPGKDEDIAGLPFVGRAGRLLTSMLKAISLERQEVYIANTVKCRPPDNRTPLIEEIKACQPFLFSQINLISPKVIVLLGKTAAMSMLGEQYEKVALGTLRQKVHWYKNIPVIVTYHPAYLLRQPKEKSKAWEDLLFAQEIYQKTTEI